MAITSPYVNPTHQDAALTSLMNSVNAMWLCSVIPQTYTEAVDRTIVNIPVSLADFSIAVGDSDGKKLRFAGKTGIATAQTSVICAVLVNTSTEEMQFINSISTTQVADQGQVTVNAFDIWEIGNPR